jgi:thymidylate synthase (FAD)
MKVIKPYFEFVDKINGLDILKKIEICGRVCYKSEGKIGDGSAEKFVASIVRRGHESVLEHVSITVKFVVDRGVSHEIVRHRIASYSQESSRYCNYSKDDFGSEITFIEPYFFTGAVTYDTWEKAMQSCENAYFELLNIGATPEQARSVLPNSLKTELVMTANIREWRNFFKVRTPHSAHPQMREVTRPLLSAFKKNIPVVFDDIFWEGENR